MAPFLFPLFGIFGLAALMNPKPAGVPQPKPVPATTPIPWYVPLTVVVVGGVLLYKVGAKTLKV